jgi:hypothetical protein
MTAEVLDFGGERSARKLRRGNRLVPRSRLQKRARLVLANGVYDSIVTDISDPGARVRIVMRTAADGNVILDVGDGNTYPAARRWARGMEMGLAFAPARDAQRRDHFETAFATVCTSDEAVKRLRIDSLFDDPSVLQAARDAEKALVLLVVALEAEASKPR